MGFEGNSDATEGEVNVGGEASGVLWENYGRK